MKLQQLRALCRARLEASRTARPAYCSDLIIQSVLKLERAALLYREDELSEAAIALVRKKTELRARGVPLSYVLHEAEFYGRKFKVGRGVLIPRPETELLVEAVLSFFPAGKPALFADWCTGSGCVAASLLLENSSLRGFGVDKSPQALRWARINIALHGLEKSLTLIKNEEPAEAPVAENSLDFITANPPYIPETELPGLMPEVRLYEPRAALDGGEEGLFLFKKFLSAFPRILKSGGMLFFETAGERQVSRLEKLMPEVFVPVNKIIDYNGIIRHIIWRKR